MAEVEEVVKETTEPTADAVTDVPTQEPIAEPEAVAEETAPEAEIPDKEPGGSDGESVYQRKLYRENKQLGKQLEQERLDKARLDERLKILEEQKEAPKTVEQVFTITQVEQAVEDGRISRTEGERYKAEVLLPKLLDREFTKRDNQREAKEKLERPLAKAKTEISEYVQLIPTLTQDGDPRATEVFQRYNELVNEYDLPATDVTKAVALRDVIGSLDKLRKQAEVRNLTRNGTTNQVEAGAGGTDHKANEGDPTKKVPADMVAEWKRTGATDEQVKKFAQFHLDKINRRRRTFG